MQTQVQDRRSRNQAYTNAYTPISMHKARILDFDPWTQARDGHHMNTPSGLDLVRLCMRHMQAEMINDQYPGAIDRDGTNMDTHTPTPGS